MGVDVAASSVAVCVDLWTAPPALCGSGGLSESAVVNLLALGLLGAMAVLEALWLFLGTGPVNAQF